jgi:phosphoribosyl 1,2-cyclic phosphate phosphodiesterase
MANFEVVILGSGTSTGIPVIGCDCAICTSKDPRNNRLRASILLQTDTGKNVIVDTGPDFRTQVLREGLTHLDAILYTHLHADHCFGFDDTRAFGFKGRGPIPCYIASDHVDEFYERFAYAFKDTGYAGAKPKMQLHSMDAHQSFDLFGIETEMAKVAHGEVQTSVFRFDNFAYATDFKCFSPDLIERWCGRIDTLVVSGIHFKTHPSHSVIPESIELAQKLKVRRTYITHISHYVDHERDSELLPAGVAFAYDGLRLFNEST